MVYKVTYTEDAQGDLAGLAREVVVRILKKVRYFVATGRPMDYAKKLKGMSDARYFRFRIGDYRVIFRKDAQKSCLVVLVVLKIGHRSSVYQGRLLKG